MSTASIQTTTSESSSVAYSEMLRDHEYWRIMNDEDKHFASRDWYDAYDFLLKKPLDIYRPPMNPTSRLRSNYNNALCPSRKIDEAGVFEWAKGPGPFPDGRYRSCLRILVLEQANEEAPLGTVTLPCSRKVYEEIEKAWVLPPRVLRVFVQGAHFASFDTGGKFGIALRSMDAPCSNSVTVYDRTTHVCSVLYRPGVGHPWTKMRKRLACIAETMSIPALFPYTQLQEDYWRLKKDHADITSGLIDVSVHLKLDPPSHLPPWRDRRSPMRDVDKGTIELTKLSQQIAVFKKSIQTLQVLTEAVTKMHQVFRQSCPESEWEGIILRSNEIKECLEHLLSEIKSLQASIETDASIAQALSSTVTHLARRRDNKLNYQAAQAARRDSSDMRTIAWVTLLFLPATFIATLFSTTFFDWKAHKSAKRVSPMFSIYIALSFVCTVCVVLYWRRKTKRADRRAAQVLDDESDDSDDNSDQNDSEDSDEEGGETVVDVKSFAKRMLKNLILRPLKHVCELLGPREAVERAICRESTAADVRVTEDSPIRTALGSADGGKDSARPDIGAKLGGPDCKPRDQCSSANRHWRRLWERTAGRNPQNDQTVAGSENV